MQEELNEFGAINGTKIYESFLGSSSNNYNYNQNSNSKTTQSVELLKRQVGHVHQLKYESERKDEVINELRIQVTGLLHYREESLNMRAHIALLEERAKLRETEHALKEEEHLDRIFHLEETQQSLRVNNVKLQQFVEEILVEKNKIAEKMKEMEENGNEFEEGKDVKEALLLEELRQEQHRHQATENEKKKLLNFVHHIETKMNFSYMQEEDTSSNSNSNNYLLKLKQRIDDQFHSHHLLKVELLSLKQMLADFRNSDNDHFQHHDRNKNTIDADDENAIEYKTLFDGIRVDTIQLCKDLLGAREELNQLTMQLNALYSQIESNVPVSSEYSEEITKGGERFPAALVSKIRERQLVLLKELSHCQKLLKETDEKEIERQLETQKKHVSDIEELRGELYGLIQKVTVMVAESEKEKEKIANLTMALQIVTNEYQSQSKRVANLIQQKIFISSELEELKLGHVEAEKLMQTLIMVANGGTDENSINNNNNGENSKKRKSLVTLFRSAAFAVIAAIRISSSKSKTKSKFDDCNYNQLLQSKVPKFALNELFSKTSITTPSKKKTKNSMVSTIGLIRKSILGLTKALTYCENDKRVIEEEMTKLMIEQSKLLARSEELERQVLDLDSQLLKNSVASNEKYQSLLLKFTDANQAREMSEKDVRESKKGSEILINSAQQLESVVTHLQAENQNLQIQLHQCHSNIDELRQGLALATKEKEQLVHYTQIHKRVMINNETLQHQLKKTENELMTTKDIILKSEREIVELNMKINRLVNEIRQRDIELQTSRKLVETLTTINSKSDTKMTELSSELDAFKEQTLLLKSELEANIPIHVATSPPPIQPFQIPSVPLHFQTPINTAKATIPTKSPNSNSNSNSNSYSNSYSNSHSYSHSKKLFPPHSSSSFASSSIVTRTANNSKLSSTQSTSASSSSSPIQQKTTQSKSSNSYSSSTSSPSKLSKRNNSNNLTNSHNTTNNGNSSNSNSSNVSKRSTVIYNSNNASQNSSSLSSHHTIEIYPPTVESDLKNHNDNGNNDDETLSTRLQLMNLRLSTESDLKSIYLQNQMNQIGVLHANIATKQQQQQEQEQQPESGDEDEFHLFNNQLDETLQSST